MPNTRLLIVDDSVIMRKAIQQVVERGPGIEVVGVASNGREAIDLNARLRPDVITMDVEMPVMDGLDALAEIMRTAPTRVLMVSALTTAGADTTLQALAYGAVDFLPKPVGVSGVVQIAALKDVLLPKITAAVSANIDALRAPQFRQPSRTTAASTTGIRAGQVVLIGASTGGPTALQRVLSSLPASLPAGVLVVQHMPPTFTAQLARRLDGGCELHVKEAEEGDEIRAGTVLLAPGDRHLVLRDGGHVGLDTEPADAPHRPAVDVLLESAAAYYGADATVVILTGMGRDGCRGSAALKEKGANVIAQDEESSVVYGMPGAVAEAGLVDTQCPLSLVPAMIVRSLRRR